MSESGSGCMAAHWAELAQWKLIGHHRRLLVSDVSSHPACPPCHGQQSLLELTQDVESSQNAWKESTLEAAIHHAGCRGSQMDLSGTVRCLLSFSRWQMGAWEHGAGARSWTLAAPCMVTAASDPLKQQLISTATCAGDVLHNNKITVQQDESAIRTR